MTEFQALLERIGACREARAWVGERSLAEAWEQCERRDWLHWLAIASAGQAYDAAIASALQAYDAAIASARQAYRAAIASAGQAYDAAIASAGQAYDAAIASAGQAHDAAIASAGQAHDECRTADAFRARIPCPAFPGLGENHSVGGKSSSLDLSRA